MKIMNFILICVLTIICFAFIPNIAKPQTETGMIEINDAIAIVSSTLGIKIIIDGNIEGQIDLDLVDKSPRQIKESLEQKLNENGFFWVAEGGVVHITKNPKGVRRASGQQLPLSYYISVISKNNLFRTLGNKPVEIKSDLVLRGIFGMGESSRAIIEDVTNNKSYYISKGESIGNSRVVEITADRVVMEGSSGRSFLKIQQQEKPKE